MKRILLFVLSIMLIFGNTYAEDKKSYNDTTKEVNERNMGYHWEDGKWIGEFDSIHEALYGAVLLYSPLSYTSLLDYYWLEINYDENYVSPVLNKLVFKNVKSVYYGDIFASTEDFENISSEDVYNEETNDGLMYEYNLNEAFDPNVCNIELKYSGKGIYEIVSYEKVENYYEFWDSDSIIFDQRTTHEDKDRIVKLHKKGPYISPYIYAYYEDIDEEEVEARQNFIISLFSLEIPCPGYLGTYIFNNKIYRSHYSGDAQNIAITVGVYDIKTNELLEQVEYQYKDGKTNIIKLK